MDPSTTSPSSCSVSLRVRLRPDTTDAFVAWHSDVVAAALGFAGFMHAEVKPFTGSTASIGITSEWLTVQCFGSDAEARAWQASSVWQALRARVLPLLAEASQPIEQVTQAEGADRDGVTEVIVTRVKPGMQAQYQLWEIEIQRAQARFPGFLGACVQPPTPGGHSWITVMRFRTPPELDAWLNSPERAALLLRGDALVDYAHLHRARSFIGWFLADPRTGAAPPSWKAAALVLLGLFPIVLLEIKFFNPLLAVLNSAVATFVANSLSVALTTWGTMPIFIKLFRWWLFPAPPSARTELKGTLLILGLFVLEIAALWRLL